MKKIVKVLMLAVIMLCAWGCNSKNPAKTTQEITATITEDTKYGSATILLSQEEFEKAGFALGDSCDIEFSNGKKIEDIPYYNGYYVKNEMPVIVAYPGFSTIAITYNNRGIWEAEKLQEGYTITIRLNQSQKYSDIQSSLGQVYSFERKDYTSDEQFCNFRVVSGGKLKENMLYRGASPVDNSRGRAAYTDAILKQYGIQMVMDLADSKANMEGYMAAEGYKSQYTQKLYEDGNVILLDMSSAYTTTAYQKKVASGMRELLKAQGPIYIHCMEGKDRTGFVCALVEALAGASYEEMRTDYMKTYENYYNVSLAATPAKYEAIAELYFDAFLSYLYGTEDVEALKKADYTEAAKAYLINGGMTQAEINQLLSIICK